MGNRTDHARAANPRLARAFDLYIQCRTQQLFHVEVTKDKGKRVEHKIVRFTTGHHHFPEDGGLLDQPTWTMDMFEVFKQGENSVAMESLSK